MCIPMHLCLSGTCVHCLCVMCSAVRAYLGVCMCVSVFHYYKL